MPEAIFAAIGFFVGTVWGMFITATALSRTPELAPANKEILDQDLELAAWWNEND